jgi:hypothetical protein
VTAQIPRPPPPRLLRSFGAILAGFVAVVGLSIATDLILHATGVFPPIGRPLQDTGLFLLAAGYRSVFAIVGGHLAARLAPDAPVRHALILGGIGFVLAGLGVAASAGKPELGPAWYPVALVVTALPCAWLGGLMTRPRGTAA